MWSQDVKKWKLVEKEFVCSLVMKYTISDIQIAQWEFKDWDIKATFVTSEWEQTRTFEIKYDDVFNRTNEVWIEYQYKWIASGIFRSKADCIVYKLGEKFWCVDRAKLLVYLTQANKTYKSGWDGWKSELWVIPAEEFYKLGKEI